MTSQKNNNPEIIEYRIPRIEVYHVTDEELYSLEEDYGQVNQDLTFAVASLSIGASFLIALLTGEFLPSLRLFFWAVTISCSVAFLYTGCKWWTKKQSVPRVVGKIRSRKTEPQVPQD